MSVKRTYGEKLLDPRWQRRRLDILNRDEWECQVCFSSTDTLHVHHRYYAKSGDPWDVPDDALITLCTDCHESETKDRPATEAGLLSVLRRRFLAGELDQLALAFDEMTVRHMTEVVISMFRMVLTDPELQDQVLQLYFARLHHLRETGETTAP